ncbi:hypothetical protein BJ508DRAFT_335825 [Ascobolus immersus RN42]|uniref:Uncharacterized protein n=1 Tax=Ascobolus immersus RN42 TaxID=1160509 RepID=A0A3N4HPR7_ASCIM|nr:hypothetical protein BJ508DRAFT_335825 [Ascobolus immersus RN42]
MPRSKKNSGDSQVLQLCRLLLNDGFLRDLFQHHYDDRTRHQLLDHLSLFFGESFTSSQWSDFQAILKSKRLPRQLSEKEKKEFIDMAQTYTTNYNHHRKRRDILLDSLRLSPSPPGIEDAATQFLSTVPRYYLHPVAVRFTRNKAYPPFLHWISKHPSHSEKFKTWINTPGLWHPDKRDQSRYYPHHQLDFKQLQLNIKADESALVYDAKTGKLVMVVLANVIKNVAILQWMSEVIGTGCKALRSIRLSDPGRMGFVGYSAGSRSATCVGWTSAPASGEEGREFKPFDNRKDI